MAVLVDNCCGCGGVGGECGDSIDVLCKAEPGFWGMTESWAQGTHWVKCDADGTVTQSDPAAHVRIQAVAFDLDAAYGGDMDDEYCGARYHYWHIASMWSPAYVPKRYNKCTWTVRGTYWGGGEPGYPDGREISYERTTVEEYDRVLGVIRSRTIQARTKIGYVDEESYSYAWAIDDDGEESLSESGSPMYFPLGTLWSGTNRPWSVTATIGEASSSVEVQYRQSDDPLREASYTVTRTLSEERTLEDQMLEAVNDLLEVPLDLGATTMTKTPSGTYERPLQWGDVLLLHWEHWPKRKVLELVGRAGEWGEEPTNAGRRAWEMGYSGAGQYLPIAWAEKALVVSCPAGMDRESQEQTGPQPRTTDPYGTGSDDSAAPEWVEERTCQVMEYGDKQWVELRPDYVAYEYGMVYLAECP